MPESRVIRVRDARQPDEKGTSRPMERPAGQPPMAQDAIDLIEVAFLLLANWWKLAICTLLGALLLFGWSSVTYRPQYRATTKLYVNNNNVSIGLTQISISSADISASQQLVETYQQFINSHYVLDTTGEVLAEDGLEGYNFYNLAGRITTSAAGNTPILNISVWDEDPENAIKVVNALTQTLLGLVDTVIEGSSITVIDPAYSATLLGSNIRRDTMRGAMLGFALSAALVLLYYYFLNDKVTGPEWLQNTYPTVPSLGAVPDTTAEHGKRYGYAYGKGKKGSRKTSGKAAQKKHGKEADFGETLDFFGTEAYNVIRTNVKFSFYGKKTGHIVGITSAMAGDGKSYTSVNLAYALAKDGSTVLLLDGDMRKLTLNRYFRATTKGGLSEILCAEMTPEEVIQHGVLHENLAALLSGSVPPNPSELLGSEQMRQLLEALRLHYDYVLLDLPPVSGVIDAVAVSKFLDGMVMVVRHDQTRKKYVRSTIRQLELAEVRLLGFVYNAEVEKYPLYAKYYKKYDGYYGAEKSEAEA